MKVGLYLIILVALISCRPYAPSFPSKEDWDSVYRIADFCSYGDYYNSGFHVYSIDLLSDGLIFDSVSQIRGTGYNLYLSDIFVSKEDSVMLPIGKYTMDSVAKEKSFLGGMNFDGNVTGTYLLSIQSDAIQQIVLFTRGDMMVQYQADDIVLNFNLYTKDSVLYRARYQGGFECKRLGEARDSIMQDDKKGISYISKVRERIK